MLQTFLPLFFMTLGICWFIVLMQFIWRYIDDMVGKGLEIGVMLEMLFYAALSLLPMALPLGILLASLMTFGNLGERLELLAMKSAGVSLIRIMKPLIILVSFISIGTFFYQNIIIPVTQVNFYSLLFSIKQKSPELEIPEGTFYSGMPGYNVYVKEKDKDTGLLKDMMIYDYSEGFNNVRVYLADSGRLKTSADKLFIVLTLYSGESFENLGTQSQNTRSNAAVPYRRETFTLKEVLIEFDANFNRDDGSWFQNQYLGKNLADLQTSIDSMSVRLDSVNSVTSSNIYTNSYRRTFAMRDTADNKPIIPKYTDEVKNRAVEAGIIGFDSLFRKETPGSQAALLGRARTSAETVKQDYLFRSHTIAEEAKRLRNHETEWHKKFTGAIACLLFFFIGAPLGAIIRKGGLGVPVIISVLLFIFYYIINNMGYKMARDSVWLSWEGMWLSSAVLLPMGIFLTYKAVNDSVILETDTYLNVLKNLIGKRSGRKIEMKEMIIFNPDSAKVANELNQLITNTRDYLTRHKRFIGYFTYWKEGGKDRDAEQIALQVESIVEELSNSNQILIINKLMDYPIVSGYNQLSVNMSKKVGYLLGILFPIGIPVYLLALYQRKLLRHDIQIVERTSNELLDMIENH